MKYMITGSERSQGSPIKYEERPEADTGGFHAMEGTRQFQNRVVRYQSGRLGWVYDVGL